MDDDINPSDDPRLRAMGFLTAALEALDASDAPADIGAHIDRAISRLSLVMKSQNITGGKAVFKQTDYEKPKISYR